MTENPSAFERITGEFETADTDWINGAHLDLRQVYNRDRRKLLGDVARSCRIEPIELDTASGLVFTPPTPRRDRAVVYFHGGGWVVGSPATHQVPCSHLANGSGHIVWSMRYGLAPENLFPIQREDAARAIEAALQQFDRVILAGDSAGAAVAFWGLHAIAPALQARIDGVVGLYGGYGVIPDETADDGPLSPRALRSMMQRMGPLEQLAATPGFNIVEAVNADCPPVFLSVGDADPLIADSRSLAERLRLLGREVELDVRQGLGHSFAHFVQRMDEAASALQAAALWIRNCKRA